MPSTTIKLNQVSPHQYTYNPYSFNSQDYTQQELTQLMRDIVAGVCVPEFTKQTLIIESDSVGEKRANRRYRFQQAFRNIHSIKH